VLNAATDANKELFFQSVGVSIKLLANKVLLFLLIGWVNTIPFWVFNHLYWERMSTVNATIFTSVYNFFLVDFCFLLF